MKSQETVMNTFDSLMKNLGIDNPILFKVVEIMIVLVAIVIILAIIRLILGFAIKTGADE